MARRKHKQHHRKASRGCAPTAIRFKTKRGKTVSFTGRPGGDSKHGGKCAHKRRPRTPQMRAIAAAGRACARVGKPGTKRNIACLRAKF
jgi:hypothetical protein